MASQRFTVDVTYDDNTVQRVQTNVRDIMAVERLLKRGFVRLIDEATMIAFANLAYQALKRTGGIDSTVTFDVWAATVAEVDPDAEEAEGVDPGSPEATDDSLSTSPARRVRASGKSSSTGTTGI